MSAESDFRAVLTSHAPLLALLASADSIAQDSVPPGTTGSVVVFSATHAPEYALDNTVCADNVTFTVQCWHDSAVVAKQVGDAVQAALTAEGVVVLTRATGFDDALNLNADVLTVEWWAG